MIKWFFKNTKSPECVNDLGLLILRVASGALMLPYGWSKIEKYDDLKLDFFGDPIGIGDLPSLWLTIFAQLVCSCLLIFGFQTRFAATVLFINMAVATKYHATDGFFVWALPVLFLTMYATLIFTGGGKYSLDNRIHK